jgi:host factor-I protein
MPKSALNIQDSFLNQARKDHSVLTIHLLDGSELRGKISAFDSFTVILFDPEQETQYLLYKHAIATITPGARELVRWNDGLQHAQQNTPQRPHSAPMNDSRKP